MTGYVLDRIAKFVSMIRGIAIGFEWYIIVVILTTPIVACLWMAIGINISFTQREAHASAGTHCAITTDALRDHASRGQCRKCGF